MHRKKEITRGCIVTCRAEAGGRRKRKKEKKSEAEEINKPGVRWRLAKRQAHCTHCTVAHSTP